MRLRQRSPTPSCPPRSPTSPTWSTATCWRRSIVSPTRWRRTPPPQRSRLDRPASPPPARAARRCCGKTGDPLWVDEALGAIRVAPGSPAALTALDALEEAEVAVALLEAGYVRYRSWDTATATELYEGVAAAPLTAADAATAWFYLGALAERDLDNPAALDAYTRSLEFDSRGYLADDAYWWLALLFEDAGRPLDAVAHYDALTVGFPSSPFAADAALRSALALAQADRDAAAAARLRQLMASAAPSQAATAARWLEVLGLRTEADLLPSDYDPSSLAAVLETAGDATLTEPLLAEWSAPEADWEEALEWMSARFGPAPGGIAPECPRQPLIRPRHGADDGPRGPRSARAAVRADRGSCRRALPRIHRRSGLRGL